MSRGIVCREGGWRDGEVCWLVGEVNIGDEVSFGRREVDCIVPGVFWCWLLMIWLFNGSIVELFDGFCRFGRFGRFDWFGKFDWFDGFARFDWFARFGKFDGLLPPAWWFMIGEGTLPLGDLIGLSGFGLNCLSSFLSWNCCCFKIASWTSIVLSKFSIFMLSGVCVSLLPGAVAAALLFILFFSGILGLDGWDLDVLLAASDCATKGELAEFARLSSNLALLVSNSPVTEERPVFEKSIFWLLSESFSSISSFPVSFSFSSSSGSENSELLLLFLESKCSVSGSEPCFSVFLSMCESVMVELFFSPVVHKVWCFRRILSGIYVESTVMQLRLKVN
jgi:hypothetical protein